jgi:hypothetical protein
VREMKANQIEDYFELIENQIVSYSKNFTVINAMKRFKSDFNDLPQEFAKMKDTLNFQFDDIKEQVRKTHKILRLDIEIENNIAVLVKVIIVSDLVSKKHIK